MITALQILAFLYGMSVFVLGIVGAIMVVMEEEFPEPKHTAMTVFWPVTLVALSPLIIVFLVKWLGILAGSFTGGISELYSKAIR